MENFKTKAYAFFRKYAPGALLVIGAYASSMHMLSHMSGYHSIAVTYVLDGVHDDLLQYRYFSIWIVQQLADWFSEGSRLFGVRGFFPNVHGRVQHLFFHIPATFRVPANFQTAIVLFEWLVLSATSLSIWHIGTKIFRRSALSYGAAIAFFWIVQYQRIANGTAIYYPYDSFIMLLFLWGVYEQYCRRWTTYYPIFLLALMTRESGLSLLILYVITHFRRVPRKTFLMHVGIHLALYIGLRVLFDLTLQVAPLNFLARHWVMVFNFFVFLRPDFWLAFVGLGGYALAVVAFNYDYLRDPFMRRAFWFFPVLFLAMFKIGMVDEFRCFNEVPPLLVLLLIEVMVCRLKIPQDTQVLDVALTPWQKAAPGILVALLLVVSLRQTYTNPGLPVAKTLPLESVQAWKLAAPLELCGAGVAWDLRQPATEFHGTLRLRKGPRYVLKFHYQGKRNGKATVCDIPRKGVEDYAVFDPADTFDCKVDWRGQADRIVLKVRDENCLGILHAVGP